MLTFVSKSYRMALNVKNLGVFLFCIFFAPQIFLQAEEVAPNATQESPTPAIAPPTTYSLIQFLKFVDSSALLMNEAVALQKMAGGKAQEVEMKRWLSTVELTAYGGVVPDARLSNRNDVNSYTSYDFENDTSISHWGGFLKTELTAIQPLWTFGKISNYQNAAKLGFSLAEWEQKKRRGEFRFLV